MADINDTRHHKVLRAEQKGDALVVRPAGDAVGFSGVDLHTELRVLISLLDGDKLSNVVVDLGAANYFGSVIIGCITSLGQRAEEVGGRLVTCNASDDMQATLQVMNLAERWPGFPSLRKALKGLK